MKSRKKADAVFTNGEYTDPKTGEKKKRYVNIGTLFESEDGRLSMKLDAIPCGPNWSGYIQFFEDRKAERPPQQRPPRQESQSSAAPANHDDDDIPF